MASGVRIKRIYDPPQAADGYRVLVDRVWPRGISKQEAKLDARDEEDNNAVVLAELLR